MIMIKPLTALTAFHVCRVLSISSSHKGGMVCKLRGQMQVAQPCEVLQGLQELIL